MYNPFRNSRTQQPFLSPLGSRRRLPAVAAPLAVTVVGGVALVVAFGALFGLADRAGRQLSASASPSEPAPAIALQAAADQQEMPPYRTPDTGAAEAGTVDGPELAPSETATREPALPLQPIGAAEGGDPDPGRTAAIAPAGAAAAVRDLSAELTHDGAGAAFAPEAKQGEARLPGGQPQNADENAETAQAAASSLRPAAVKGAVNLRAGPDNGARVLTVVPGGAAIEAEEDCNWCAASYDGRSGFIYKSFIVYR